jgi:hypothetical protein
VSEYSRPRRWRCCIWREIHTSDRPRRPLSLSWHAGPLRVGQPAPGVGRTELVVLPRPAEGEHRVRPGGPRTSSRGDTAPAGRAAPAALTASPARRDRASRDGSGPRAHARPDPAQCSRPRVARIGNTKSEANMNGPPTAVTRPWNRSPHHNLPDSDAGRPRSRSWCQRGCARLLGPKKRSRCKGSCADTRGLCRSPKKVYRKKHCHRCD